MADISFDDLIPSKSQPTPAPSKGADVSFDDLVPKPSSTGVESKGGAAFGIYPKPGMKPGQTTSDAAKTAQESFVRSLPGTAGFLAGAGAAEGATSFITTPLAVANPIAGGLAKLAINMTGGVIVAGGATKVAEYLEAAFDPEGFAERKTRREQYPKASSAGEVVAGFAGSSSKVAPEVAGKFFSKPIVQRGTSAALMGGMSAAEQVAKGEDVDLTQAAVQAVGGFVLPGLNVAGKVPFGLGEKLGTKVSDKLRGVKAPKLTPDPLTTKLDETSTPEEHAALLQELETIKTKRVATAPLVETGMKNTKTGEEIKMGAKHDQAKKEELKNEPDWQEGFFDERGTFHERQTAVDQAKRSGQIPQDHVLENPPGERPGLHSGDMRAVGDKRFEITTEESVGKSRESYKADITKNENERINLKIAEQKARLANDHQNADRLKQQIDKLEAEHTQLVKDMPAVQFKNKSAPTHEEWHDHVWGSKTLGEAIDKTLAVKELGGLGQRLLMKALRGSEFISNAKLELTKDILKYKDKSGKEKNALGLYYGGAEHRVELGKGSSITELLHEAMHAGTQKLLLDKTSPAAIEMHKLFDKYQQEHITKYEEDLERFKENNPNATLEDLNKFKEDNDPYGFENVDEFVAEAFTDKKFQELLSGLDVRERTGNVISNMWDSFKEVVRLNLGVPEKARSAFDDVIELGSTLVEESKTFRRDAAGTLVVSPSRLSQQVHDELEREGIAIAHTSPHKFGMFDWVKHALSGEGANVFGAGTYGSQKDSTNTFYVEMAKKRALDKYLESPEGKVDKDKLNVFQQEAFFADEKVGDIYFEIKRTVQQKEALKDQLIGPEGDQQKEWAKRKIQELEIKEAQLKDEYDFANEDALTKHYAWEAEIEQLAEEIKVPTYHSSIKATSDELLDWNSTQQSDFVTSAFKNLGIESANNLDKATELKINQALQDGWYGDLLEDGSTGVTVLGRDYVVGINKLMIAPNGVEQILSLVIPRTGEIVTSFEQAKKSVLEMIYQDQGFTKKTGEQLYRELSVKLEPTDAVTRNLITDREAKQIGMAKASIVLAEQGVVGNVHNAQGGTEEKFRNYVVFDDSRITQNFVVLASKEKKTTPSSTGEPVELDRTKTDVREIKDLAEFKEIAADIYEKHGDVEAIKFYEAYKAYEKTKLEPVKTTEQFVGTSLTNKLATERIVHNNTADLKEMAGNEVDLEQLTYDIDKGTTLTGKAKEVANKFRELMDDLGKRALENGVIKGWHENYVARNVVTEGAAPPTALQELMADLFGSGGKGTDPKSVTKYGEERRLKTREDLVRHLEGINSWLERNGAEYRFKLKTDNLADIYKDYALAVEKTIENKNLIDNLLHIKNAAGESLIRRITDEEPKPYGYETMDNSELAGYAVHPDLMPHLKFVFDAGPGKLMQAFGAISQFAKRFNVIGSFFHAKSLMEAQSSAQIPIWTPLKEAVVLPIAEKLFKSATGKDLQMSAISKAVEQFRRGGAGDNVDTWIKTGLGFELPEDVSRNILASTGKFADSMIGKFGPKSRVLESSMSTVEKYTLNMFDKFTWDYLHTGLKLSVADAYLDKARQQAAKDGKPFDEMAARKEIATFVNNSFGGLNWYQAAIQTQNEFAKRMALAAYSPKGRRALQVLLFAPDWTISTLRAFTSALPKELVPTKWHPIEGVKGMLSPTTTADYARMYQFKTALTYLTLLNCINLMYANRNIWENKDPTRIEFPDGTSMQAMKHAMEPYHWIADPDKTLSNKMGFIPKALIIGFGGVEYASPNAPKLVDRSATSRLKTVAKTMMPFQAQASIDAPEGEGVKRAVLGTMGLPVYGSTPEQRKLANAEHELATKEQAWKYRDKEIKAGRMPLTDKHAAEEKALAKRREKIDKAK
jgi:hypothetical protein